MLLTAQQSSAPGSSRISIPPQFLERATQLLSEHKAVRLVPEDEAVTVEEAAELLGTFSEDVSAMLKLRLLRCSEQAPELVRLDDVLKRKYKSDKYMRSPVAKMFRELKDIGLYD